MKTQMWIDAVNYCNVKRLEHKTELAFFPLSIIWHTAKRISNSMRCNNCWALLLFGFLQKFNWINHFGIGWFKLIFIGFDFIINKKISIMIDTIKFLNKCVSHFKRRPNKYFIILKIVHDKIVQIWIEKDVISYHHCYFIEFLTFLTEWSPFDVHFITK